MSDELKRHPEGPDPEFDGDLLEDSQADPIDDEDLTALSRRRHPLVILVAVVALMGLLVIFLRPFADLRDTPSLSFLYEARELEEVPLIQELREASVLLNIVRRNGESALGSGFNVAPDGVIVTNKHVVADARSITVTFRGRGTFPVGNWITHPRADLAIVRLRSDERDLPTVTVASGEPPLVGTPVYIIGNPLGIANTAVRGTLRSYAFTSAAEGMAPMVAMVLEAPIHPGSSGSPVFDDQGSVLGVVFAQLPKEDGMPDRGLAIPVAVLEDWLL